MKNYGGSEEGHFDWNNSSEGNAREGSMTQRNIAQSYYLFHELCILRKTKLSICVQFCDLRY